MLKFIRGNAFFLFFLVLMAHITFLLVRINLDHRPALPSSGEIGKEGPLKIKLLEVEKHRQIVRSSDSADKIPREGAFLSDKTRSFERQSKARRVDTFAEGKKRAGQSGPTAEGGRQGKSSQGLSLSDLGAHRQGGDPFRIAAKEYSRRKNGGSSGGSSPNAVVSSTSDHVEEIPLGDVTNLNTVEYKYYGFYFRIRQRLEQFWGKSIQEKAQALVRQGRQLAADDQHVTSLQITLDDEGKIVEIAVRGSSGVRELDEAAVDSFNEAGPFPNPPKDLVKNGRVTLEWGFVVQT